MDLYSYGAVLVLPVEIFLDVGKRGVTTDGYMQGWSFPTLRLGAQALNKPLSLNYIVFNIISDTTILADVILVLQIFSPRSRIKPRNITKTTPSSAVLPLLFPSTV